MASYDWTGTAGDDLFSNPDNWGPLGAPAGPPAQGDDASITNGAVEIDQATIEVGSLAINSGSLDDNGRRLVAGGLLSVGSPFGATAELTVEDGEVDFGELDLDLNTSNLSGGRIELQGGVLGGGPLDVNAGTSIQGTGQLVSSNGTATLLNHGSVEAEDIAGNLVVPGQLSILTNIITNEPDGIFRADHFVTLSIGSSAVPLDADHVFTNLQDLGDGTNALVDGAYIAAVGDIVVTGFDGSGSPLGPITTLSALVEILGNGTVSGDIFVNGQDIESSLNTITPSADGEGDLVLINSFSDWQNPVEIQGLTSAEPASFTLAYGTTWQGGGLYLDAGVFNGAGLTIDAADAADPGSQAAFISGSGIIDCALTMNGVADAAPTALDDILELFGPVAGSGQYFINTDPVSGAEAVLQFDQSLVDLGGGNTVTFNDASLGAQLRLNMIDVTHEFQATIRDFGPFDQIILTNIHATSATFDGASNVLSIFDAFGNMVAALRLDDSVPDNQTFAVSSSGFTDGGSGIRWSNPDFAPAITGNFNSTVGEGTLFEALDDGFNASLQFHDANPGASYLDALKIESDHALGSFNVSDGPLALNTAEPVSGGVNPLGLTYQVADSGLDFLQAGGTRTETFYLELTDGSSENEASTTQAYTVTLLGQNDAPVIGNADLPSAELGNFSLAGDATLATGAAHPDDFIGDNIYDLVAASAAQPGQFFPRSAGAIWHPIDLSQNFSVHARLYFGGGVFNQFNSGAGDGITFALQDTGANAIGDPNAGNGLGLGSGLSGLPASMPHAVGVKFDTYNNPTGFTPSDGFAQFFASGDPGTLLSDSPAQIPIGNVDDGSWHDLVVSWDATGHQLVYTLDGQANYTLVRDLVGTDFGGASQVYAGFTGSIYPIYGLEQVEVDAFSNGTQLARNPKAYSIDVSPQLAVAGIVSSSDITVDFSDPDQRDTHTTTIGPGTVVSAPGSYSGGAVGQWVRTGFQDTINGLNGKVTGHFAVAANDIAFLHAGDQLLETFDLSIDDGHGGVTSQPITVTIIGSGTADTAPVAADDSFLLPPNAVDFSGGNVLANDSDPDGDPLTAHLQASASHGQLLLFNNGSFDYTPTAGFHGTDSFTYFASDGILSSKTATVTFNVDTAPVAADDSYIVPEDQASIIAAPGVLANDSDPDGDPLTANPVIPGGAAHGHVDLNTDGSFVYTPDAGFHGADSFLYFAKDGVLGSNPGTVTLHVDAAPLAADDSFLLPPNSVDFSGGNVLANDSDPDGDPLTAHLQAGASHGQLLLFNNGSFDYTPTAAFHGTDSFTYFASDGILSSKTATVTFNVDTAPVAADDSYTVAPGQTLTIAGPGVLANDSDPDGDPLTANPVIPGGAAHGHVDLNTDGSFVYTPDAGFHGTDSFLYFAKDGVLGSNPATVTLHVDAAPVAADDNFLLPPNAVDFSGGNVLANDSDPDGDPLTAHLQTGASHGQLLLFNNGLFDYTPTAGFHGTDSFTYFASDGILSSKTATVTFNVDTAPVAADDSYIVAPGQTLTIAGPGVLANDSDPDGDPLTANPVIPGGAAHGHVDLSTDGSFVYTPDAGFHGADSFLYFAKDGVLGSNPATVTLNVDAAPLAADDSYVVAPGQAFDTNQAKVPGVLSNDTDPDGDRLRALLRTRPLHGSLVLNADGSFVYTPNSGFHGTDGFRYIAFDGVLESVAEVTLNVDAAPVAVNNDYFVAPGQTLTITGRGVLGDDTDAEGDPLTARLVTGPQHGQLLLSSNGQFVYTPEQGFRGADSFTYVANDGITDSNIATVMLVVDSAPTTPVDYYLTASGLDGGVVVPGHEGAFAVADFSFDIDALSSWTSAGGATVGKPNPGPLIIDLKPGAGLNGFVEDITQGHAITHVRLEGVTAVADGAQTVYDLRLDDVFVTKVTDSNGGDHLEFVYKAVTLTTTVQSPDGSLTPQTVGWDVPSGTKLASPLGAPAAGTSGGAANPVDYYLTVSGLDGGVAVAGHEGAFAVSRFSFDIDALSSWTSGGGAIVGKPNPAPLIIDLKPGADLNGFVEDITQGHAITRLRLEGVTAAADGAQTVYDLRLDDVFVTKVNDSDGVDRLELVYKAVSLTTTAENPDGSLGTPQTIGWDVTDGTRITSPLAAAAAGTSGGAANPVDYYLTVSGLDGGVVVPGHVGAFAVASFNFDIDALSSWTAGGGAIVGKPDPAPLIIDLKPGADLNGFVEDITQGHAITSLRLEGVTAAADGAQTVYDLRLKDAFVTKVTDGDGVDRLKVVYRAVSLTTTSENPDGSLGTPQTIGWDVTDGTKVTSPLAAAVAGTSGGAANPVDYYLTVSGLDGGVAVPGHEGAFAVADFSFDIDALSSWTAGGGAIVGKPNPAPLIIDLKPGADLNGFIEDITQGQVITRLRLEGVTAAADGAQTVYDLRLKDAFVTKVTDGDGVDHLEVVYRVVTLTTTSENPDGSLGTPQTIGWDVTDGTKGTSPLAAPVAGTSGGAANPVDYYLTVSGLDGGVVVPGHVGAFAVADFSFDINALSNWTATASATIGKPNPEPLIIDLKPGADLNGFIADITQGQVITRLRLEGVTAAADGAQTVYDLRLKDAFVTKVTDSNGVDHLKFVYRAVSLTTTSENPDGSLGTPQTIGWDVTDGTKVTSPLAAAVAGSSGGAASPVDFYLTVSGLDGGVVVPGHVGAFTVADFSFDIDALSNWTAAGGANVGKQNPAPLNIDFNPGADPNGFIANITQGKEFPRLRLEGVTAAADGAQTVYDLRLDDVLVSKVTVGSGVDHLELVYKAVSLTTTDQSPDGSLGTPQTIGWNVPAGTTFTTPLGPVAANDSYLVPVDRGFAIAAPGVLGNDTDAEGDPLTARLVSGPSHGRFLFGFNGQFTYTPDQGFHGTDSFTYVANDGFVDSNIATVTLNVDAAPVAVADSYSVAPGQILTIAGPGVLANDTDPDGDPLRALLRTRPANGSLVLNTDGSFVYTPNAGFHGIDGFRYAAFDGALDSVATVTLIVESAPVATDNSFIVPVNGALGVGTPGVLFNDTDAERDPLTARLIQDVKDGSLHFNTDGSFTYTPDPGFHGTDSFTYVANDGHLDSNVATVTLKVDTAPVAVGDSYVVVPNQSLFVPLPGVLANDSDAEGDSLTARLGTLPKNGSLDFLADGSVLYAPNRGFHGIDTFTYAAFDGSLQSSFATVTLTVDHAPTAANESVTVAENGPRLNGSVKSLSGDADGDRLTWQRVTTVSHGSLSFDGSFGTFSYLPNTGFVGTDSFTYRVNDGFLSSSIATVTINVRPPPTATNDQYTGLPGQPLTIAAPGLFANDTDPNGDLLTPTQTSFPADGSVALHQDGSFTYTPNTGFHGIDSFTYAAFDGHLLSKPATVTLTIDHAPTAANESVIVAENGSRLNGSVKSLSGDADGDRLTWQRVTTVSHGSLSFDGSLGTFSYLPDTGFVGTDSFTYRVNDTFLSSGIATVTIDVRPPPTATNDQYIGLPGQPLTIAAPGLLANDTDPNGDLLTPTQTSFPADGSVALHQDGSFTYTPNTGFHGIDSFTYAAFDGHLLSKPATVTLTIDHAPTAANESVIVAENGSRLNGSVKSLSGDADGDRLTWQRVTTVSHGSLSFDGSLGTFSYLPNASFAGTDSFTYRVNDGFLSSSIATVTINVLPRPAANNDQYVGLPDQPLTIAAPGVLANDTDPNGKPLTVTQATFPTHGSVALHQDGSFTYTPNTGFGGVDSFSYAASDGVLQSTSATVTLIIEPPLTLLVALSGIAQEGSLLAATPTLAGNSSGSVADVVYQWMRNGIAIGGATGSTYRLTEFDEGAQVTVAASFSEDTGRSVNATSNQSGFVKDAPPTLSVSIKGSAQEGQVLSAVANATSDGDGGRTSYQWQELVGSNWGDIEGATLQAYRVTEAEEGLQLRVRATFTDETGQSVSVASAPTAAVVDPPPTLSVIVTGIAQEGQTLSAVAHATSDADGGTTRYQWQRLVGSTWTDIGGATASSYRVSEPDEGFQLRVTATFTDDTGQTASATSTASPLVVDAKPTLSVSISGIAQDGQTLNAIAIANDSDAVVTFQWQQLIGGSWTDIKGATSSSYLVNEADEGHRLRVMARSTDEDGGGASAISTTTALVTDPAPMLAIANSSLFVVAGGSVPLSINVAGFDPDDSVRVTIAGLPAYETISDALDPRIFAGSSVVLSAAEVNSGLTLHSSYTGSGQPVDNLTVTAANSEPGQFSTSLPQTITVTDPPVSTTPGGLPGRIDVIGSGPLSDNPDFGGGADSIGRSVGLLANYMASGLVPAGYEGLGNALADRAGSLPGEIPSLVQPSRYQPAA